MATKKMTKEELKEKMATEAKKISAKPVEKALKASSKKKIAKVKEQTFDEVIAEAEANPKSATSKMKSVAKTKEDVAKPTTKKPTTKKAEPKESPMDKFFPPKIEVDGTEFERHEEITSWEDFKVFTEAFMQNKGSHVVIASSWPKKFKKDYNDNNYGEKLFPKDGFKHDLDLNEVFMFLQTREAVIVVSVVNEAVVLFKEEDFELTDFGYFIVRSMPFMVYTYTDAE